MKNVVIVNRINTDNFGDRIISKSMHELFQSININVFHADFIFNPDKFSWGGETIFNG